MVDVHEIEDISELCRVCLQLPESSQVLDLTLMYDEDDQLSYYDCFTICTQIDLLENLDLPHSLCKSCGLELQMAYDFHKKVEESKRFLEKINSRIQNTTTELEHLVTDELAATEELSEQLECEEIEEHLDMDDYQVVEELDEDLNSIDRTDEKATRLKPLKTKIIACEGYDNEMENEDNLSFDNLYDKVYEDIENDMKISRETKLRKNECSLSKNQISNELQNENMITSSTNERHVHKRSCNKFGPPFECEYCGHLSPTRALLASHRHRKHRLKDKLFQCSKCEKRFEQLKQLERHMKRPTCNVYPEFNCEYCDKKCIGLSNYNIHLRFHTKQYPFVCHLCAKRFMMATHLNNHVKTKHENQRYFCDHPNCGKMFQTRSALKIHAYSHLDVMPYKCDYCNHMYPSKGKLRWHISKSHGIQHTLDELDSMMVAEKISIIAEMRPASMDQ